MIELGFDTSSYIALMLIGMALSFPPCGFAIELVKEREINLKHQLLVMGVSPVIYWATNFIRDLCLLLFPCIVIYILIWAFSVPFLPSFSSSFLFPEKLFNQ